MKRFLLLGLFATRAWACDGVQVLDGWVREAPPGAEMMAGYATFTNKAAKPRSIRSITSPDFGEVEMHETTMVEGEMRMRALSNLRLPAHGSAKFAPGGKHLMLMQPARTLKAGDTVSLGIRCASGAPLNVSLPVRAGP